MSPERPIQKITDETLAAHPLAVKLSILLAGVLLLVTNPAAAQCTTPSDLQPLFDLLDSLAQVAMAGGIGIGALGFAFAGIMVAWPGQDLTRQGKSVAKNTMLGVVILLSANMVIAFVAAQLGAAGCV